MDVMRWIMLLMLLLIRVFSYLGQGWVGHVIP